MICSSRDDFSEATKRTLSARANLRCSNPDCHASTSGPHVDPGKALNIGVAAHIAGAAPGGPRYDRAMTPKARADISNGVWLCQNCAKLVDNDPMRFSAALLRDWKATAEKEAFDLIGKIAPQFAAGPAFVDKWVNLLYPEKAGVKSALTAQGYDLRWTAADKESARVDIEGWEPVLVDQPDGTKARLKIRDQSVVGGYMILLRRKMCNRDDG